MTYEPHALQFQTEEPPRRRTPLVGIAAVVIVVALAVLEGVAISIAVDRDFELASLLAAIVIGGTVLAFTIGLIAVIVGRGRRWGIAAMVLSVLVNPIILTAVLSFFGTVTGS